MSRAHYRLHYGPHRVQSSGPWHEALRLDGSQQRALEFNPDTENSLGEAGVCLPVVLEPQTAELDPYGYQLGFE